MLDYIQDVNEETAAERETITELIEERNKLTQQKPVVDELKAELAAKQQQLESAQEKIAVQGQQIEHAESELAARQSVEKLQLKTDENAELTEAAQMNSELLRAVHSEKLQREASSMLTEELQTALLELQRELVASREAEAKLKQDLSRCESRCDALQLERADYKEQSEVGIHPDPRPVMV